MREGEIIHETSHLYLYRTPDGVLELRVHVGIHTRILGYPISEEAGMRAMRRFESRPDKLKTLALLGYC